MPLTMQSRWECDGCKLVVILPERNQPEGWVQVEASVLPNREKYVHFVCDICWLQAPWSFSREPMPPNPMPATVRPVDTSVIHCGVCGKAIGLGSTTCPHCFASDEDE